jgi:hypothetical protein
MISRHWKAATLESQALGRMILCSAGAEPPNLSLHPMALAFHRVSETAIEMIEMTESLGLG